MGGDGFLDHVTERLVALPGIQAVTLGGSRAQGTHRDDSDWDMGIYYRGAFDPQALRDLGWPGEVSEIGGWGGGVFNGGAWLKPEGRQVDVHYRDLDTIDYEIAEANEGRFRIEPLMFHLAGIPSYLVVGELAINRVLHGRLPRPDYPAMLRRNASKIWWGNVQMTLSYAQANHARHGRLAQCVGLLAQATTQAAHAILAARRRMGNQREDPAHPGKPSRDRPDPRRRPPRITPPDKHGRDDPPTPVERRTNSHRHMTDPVNMLTLSGGRYRCARRFDFGRFGAYDYNYEIRLDKATDKMAATGVINGTVNLSPAVGVDDTFTEMMVPVEPREVRSYSSTTFTSQTDESIPVRVEGKYTPLDADADADWTCCATNQIRKSFINVLVAEDVKLELEYHTVVSGIRAPEPVLRDG